MQRHRLLSIVACTLLSAVSASRVAAQPQETPIPRSSAEDRAKYFLLEAKRGAATVKTVHKRVSLNGAEYTRAEIDCNSKQVRELGYSAESASKIQDSPSEWIDIIPGSSKGDLARVVCRSSQ